MSEVPGASAASQPVSALSVLAVAVVLVGALVAALGEPGTARAHRGDGVFTVASGRWARLGDVAMLADGSVVVGFRRLTLDGRRSRLPASVGGGGFAATSDGSVLVIGLDHRIRRWTPGVGVSVVAGTGVAGFGGDGGPATQALLNLAPQVGEFEDPLVYPTGIVARPDGGFVFSDAGNHRIRAVDGAGIIRTLAGGSAATLDAPIGLAATADGGYLVTEAEVSRVRRIRSNGGIETIARLGAANDVVVTADGSAIISQYDEGGNLWRLAPGSRRLTPYLRPERPGDTLDFAARETLGESLGNDLHGGLLVAGRDSRDEGRVGGRLTYVPSGPTPWTLVALRDMRTSRRGVRAMIEATQPGTATLEIVHRRHVIARATRPVTAGHSVVRAVGTIRNRWYDARVRLESASGAMANDELPIHGAHRLTLPLARTLLGAEQGNDDDEAIYRLGRDCRRFGQRRVDCEIRDDDKRCAAVASVTLGRSGIVLRRHYRCRRRARFRRHPQFITDMRGVGVQRLSRDDGGSWEISL